MMTGISTARERIRDLLATASEPLSSAQLADLTDRGQCHINAVLKLMKADGEAVRASGKGRLGSKATWVAPGQAPEGKARRPQSKHPEAGDACGL